MMVLDMETTEAWVAPCDGAQSENMKSKARSPWSLISRHILRMKFIHEGQMIASTYETTNLWPLGLSKLFLSLKLSLSLSPGHYVWDCKRKRRWLCPYMQSGTTGWPARGWVGPMMLWRANNILLHMQVLLNSQGNMTPMILPMMSMHVL